MDWLKLAYGLVQLGLIFFKWVEDKAQQRIGEDREKLKQFTAMREVSATLKEVDERFAKMTDAEIKTEIESHGDFRD